MWIGTEAWSGWTTRPAIGSVLNPHGTMSKAARLARDRSDNMTLSTTHGTTTVQQVLDLYAKKRLNLDPAFQRQSVWGTQARRLLIEDS